MTDAGGETQGKFAGESALIRCYQVFIGDLNQRGVLYGGRLLAIIDSLCAQAARNHAGVECVTASVDSVHFLAPVYLDENLWIKVSVNRVWNTSMEVGAKVLVQRKDTYVHVASAYLTFVAIDNHGKPVTISPITPQSEDEKRRFAAADERRKIRLASRPKPQSERSSHS